MTSQVHGDSTKPRRSLVDFVPPEILCRILCFLRPRDVVRLRLVSKTFHDTTYDAAIWKTIYANACLPRPPGPFPFQSARFLERTLIQSERLAETWTTRPIGAILRTQIQQFEVPPRSGARIIGSRWLVTVESRRRAVLFHDIETNSCQVPWEDAGDAGLITSWGVCSVVSSGGLLVYVAFHKDPSRGQPGGEFGVQKLLEFRVQQESGHVSHADCLDVPGSYPIQSIDLRADKALFIYIIGQHLVFDTQTRTFHEFPALSSELEGLLDDSTKVTPLTTLLTDTYFVVVSLRVQRRVVSSFPVEIPSTLVQAFVLPENHRKTSTGTGVLQLTHESIIPFQLESHFVIRKSIVDPITELTSIRLLCSQAEFDRQCFHCVDLTLQKSHSNAVLPVSVEVTDIFTVENGRYDMYMSPYGYFIESSDDGYARGFCKNLAQGSWTNPPSFTTFTIDASGEKCVAVVGQASPLGRISGADLSSFVMTAFDGFFGRCCLIDNRTPTWRLPGRSVGLYVVDLE